MFWILNMAEKVFTFCRFRIEHKFQLTEKRNSHRYTLKTTKLFFWCKNNSWNTIIASFLSSKLNLNWDKVNQCWSRFQFHFSEENFSNDSLINTNSYLACVYDNHWFVALALFKDEEENEVEVKFLHSFGPASYFHWTCAGKNDVCHVLISNIICSVCSPFTKGAGRVYYFSDKEVQFVEEKYKAAFCLNEVADFSTLK